MSKLEVCVDNLESAVAAIDGGAHRLELCSSLADGGLTPTPGLLLQVQKCNKKKIPINVMLRCRAGNFIYTPEETEVMKEDAKVLKKYGCDGFVFGALLKNGDVDMKTCREIVKVCFPLPITFHRAFDFCRRPTIEIEVIIDLGFRTVLTSGKQKTAQLGVKLIKKLIDQVGERIVIMPGSGLSKDNVEYVREHSGAREFHGAFRKVASREEVEDNDGEELRLADDERSPIHVDRDHVTEVVRILSNCTPS